MVLTNSKSCLTLIPGTENEVKLTHSSSRFNGLPAKYQACGVKKVSLKVNNRVSDHFIIFLIEHCVAIGQYHTRLRLSRCVNGYARNHNIFGNPMHILATGPW